MRRKKNRTAQLLAIAEAWRQYRGAPPMRLYWAEGWELQPDRCLVLANPELLAWIQAQADDPNGCLIHASRGVDAHQPLFPIVTEVVAGWRGIRAFAAIQIILHRVPGLPDFLEIDWDLGNPSRGILPAGLHAGEWIIHRTTRWFGRRVRTNPYRIARWMRWDGIPVERV